MYAETAETATNFELFLTDVRRTVTTSVICVQKIQTYTFLYAEFVKEAFEQVYFNE